MLLAPKTPGTHHDVIAQHQAQNRADIASGKYEPILYPWAASGAVVVLIYLLIPHSTTGWLRKTRWPVWGFNAVFSAYLTLRCRAQNNEAAMFGIGIISAWSVLWTAVIMIVHDCQTDFQRIERAEREPEGKSLDANGSNGAVQQNGTQNGSATSKPIHMDLTRGASGPAQRCGPHAWQAYPLTPFIERLDWIADVFTSWRGVGWSYQLLGVPPPPKFVQEQLHETSGTSPTYWRDPNRTTGYGGTRRFDSGKELLYDTAKTLVANYFILDILKVVMMRDPYYWGNISSPAPSYLPAFVASSPTLLRAYRLAIVMFAIKTPLQTIFALAPLTFSLMLGPHVLGVRGEPWMYPTTWGNYGIVLDKGLAGWWGQWWHQTFGVAFRETGHGVTNALGLKRKSLLAKVVQVFTAFGLSGAMHACGSFTQPGKSYPLSGPMAFFLLQAVAVTAEAVISDTLRKRGFAQKVPRRVQQVLTFVYVHIWFLLTGPILVDDFARGGLWLYEPVPFSPIRGLGLGVEGDGFWCWGSQMLFWHRGKHWWQTGVSV